MIAAVRDWSSRVGGSLRARPALTRRLVELVLVLLIAVQIARLAWIALDPGAQGVTTARPAAAPPVDGVIFQRFDAFFRTGGQSGLAGAEAGPGQMRLFGVRADGRGGGSAIIGLADGRQLSVGVGEAVEPGLILQSVADDHVTLSRGGSVSRLEFTDAPVGAAPPPPPPAGEQVVTPQAASAPGGPAPPPATVDPARLVAQAGLRPRMQGLNIKGFTLSPRGDGAALRAAGLQSGDVILSVNGTELNSLDRIGGLQAELSNAPQVEIRYERGGQVRTTTIRTGQ